MDRRQLLKTVAGAAALGALTRPAVGQAATAPPAGGFALSAYSRNLQWLRTPQELAKGIIELGLRRVDLTVAADNGHVNPARVAAELPAYVAGLRQAGIAVTAITTDITGPESPGAEAIIRAAAAAGVPYYVWGGLRYDEARPYPTQAEALKARMTAMARLNERHRIKGLYHPTRGAGNVGATFYDLLDLMRGLDPRYSGIHYDTAALLQATPETTVTHLRHGGPYIGGIAINDAVVHLELPEYRQGPYWAGTTRMVGQYTGGDYTRPEGDWLAIGGGGRPLPYRYRPVRVGTGMINLELLGKTLKDIEFNGLAETHVDWELDGVEKGATRITSERLNVIGQIKRDRLIVEQAFADPWNINVARPPYIERRRAAARGQAAPAAPARGGGGDGAPD